MHKFVQGYIKHIAIFNCSGDMNEVLRMLYWIKNNERWSMQQFCYYLLYKAVQNDCKAYSTPRCTEYKYVEHAKQCEY